MGNSEEAKPCKSETPLPPALDKNGVHVYPDWAMMQAYYGPRFPVPPYMNSAVTSHTPPPYMWIPPQSMIPPYGVPYATFYAHGGSYGQPGISIAGAPFGTDTPVKSSSNSGGFMKKLKEVDGLAISIGNGHADGGDDTDHRMSESDETDDSSDGSNAVTAEIGQIGMKRSRSGSPNGVVANVKAQRNSNSIQSAEVCKAVGQGTDSMIESSRPSNVTSATKTEKMETVLDLNDPSGRNLKPMATVPKEAWLQDERELKCERRKQSNRESARRSRLRKQAEAEQLTTKVQMLTTENLALKSKIKGLMEISGKLKLQNVNLMKKLKDAQTEEVNFQKVDRLRLNPIGTANLLDRVNENENEHKNRANEEGGPCEKRNPVAKLHQLLDAVAAT